MNRLLLVICIITIFTLSLNALGTFHVKSIKELPETHMNLEVRDVDGKWAPVLIVKTELKVLGFKNIGRPTKHAPIYNEKKNEYKFYMNDKQRVVEITHSEYEPLEVRLLADYKVEVHAQRVYEMVLTNVPEKIFINVVIMSDPADAEKIVDGKNLGTDQSFKLSIGTHTLKIQKEGFKSKTKTITVSESSTLFKDIKLEEIDILAIKINSVPQGATIYIDNVEEGITDKGFFKYPGTYELKLTKTDYLDINEQITVAENKSNVFYYNLIKNSGIINFSITPAYAILRLNGKIFNKRRLELRPGKYDVEISKSGYLSKFDVIYLELGETINKQFILQKNVGILKLSITPSDAVVQINNKTSYGKTTNIELAPGKYKIEVQKQGYFLQSELIDIELNKTISRTFSLKQMKGKLQFNITPLIAKIEMKKDGLIYKEWTGMKILKDVPVSEYEIICKADGFKTKKEKVVIELDKTNTIDLVMEEGSDIPDNMVFVQGGTFQMGSNDGEDDEKPIHTVTVSDFYIGKYEVTQKEWKEIMGNNPSNWKGWKGDNLPVEKVSWYDAVEFCNKKSDKEGLMHCYSGSGKNIICNYNADGYRLPTEAEWEYAARGGNRSREWPFSGSDNIGNVAWYSQNSGNKTHPVGTKQANELGIYDMSGNVWEWCNDWYDENYYKSSSKNNPKGASSGKYAVLRGGSWGSNDYNCRVANRYWINHDNGSYYFGFRFSRTP